MTLKKFKLQSGLRKGLGQAPIPRLEITLGDFSVLNDIGAVKNTETAIGKAAKFKGNVIDIKLGPWVGTGSGKKAKAKGKPKAKAPLKPKKPRPSIIARLLRSTAKKGLKRAARPKTILKQLRNVGLKRNARTILGVGSRKRVTPKSATVRAGIRSLRGGSAAIARFIALRYSPKAIAKYNNYGRRLAKSRRLIKRIVTINTSTYRIGKHVVFTDTAGNNPYSCSCPDFSQFSSDARTWLGSAAGPFNPCKHMMAVRDRTPSGPPPRPPFRGGQCAGATYSVGMVVRAFDDFGNFLVDIGGLAVNCIGPISEIGFFSEGPNLVLAGVYAANGFQQAVVGYLAGTGTKIVIDASIVGSPNDCGNPPAESGLADVSGCTDPAANNFNAMANIDNGSCTYTILGCTDPSAFNYDPLANTDDGSCIPVVLGCIDPLATNYDPAANTDDESCTY